MRGSQIAQDLFVLSVLGDERPGTFLDVGCGEPFRINNTCLLEARGWRGLSIDQRDLPDWNARRTPFVRSDALTCDYAELLKSHELPSPVDYLSVDLVRPGDRFAALRRVLATEHRFRVLTIEHDAYRGDDRRLERAWQRALLEAAGYTLVGADVCLVPGLPMEDWWVDLARVDEARVAPFRAAGLPYPEIFRRAGIDPDALRQRLSQPEEESRPAARERVLIHGDPGYRAPRTFDWTREPAEATCDLVVAVGGEIQKQAERPGRKVGWIRESPAISVWQRVTPEILRNLDSLAEAYEVILTCDRGLCELHPVLQYNPAGANLPWPWIDEADWRIRPKSKNCSMFASPKLMVDGHVERHRQAHRLKDQLDLFGGAWGSPRLGHGTHPDKSEGLVDYRFHVAMENCRVDLYYTEKLTDCFAVGTVPVYWGCDAIGEVFDTAGILRLDDDFRIESLSDELYREMLPAVRNNLEILRGLESSADRLYRKFVLGR